MIVFLYGDNDYAIHRHILKLKDQYRKKFVDSLEQITLDMNEATMAELQQTLLAMPMFYSHRLVIVNGIMAIKNETDKLSKLLSEVPDSTVVVIDGRGIDKRSRLYKDLVKLPNSKAYPALKPADLNKSLIQEAKRLGSSISPGDAAHLIQRAGTSQWRLTNELVKLSADGEAITRHKIDQMVALKLEDSVFDLVAAITQGERAQALQLTDELSLQGVSPPAIIGALNWQYRVFALALDGADDTDLAAVGVSPYALSRARDVVRTMSYKAVAEGYGMLLAADMAMKRGELKPDQAMTWLIMELCRTKKPTT